MEINVGRHIPITITDIRLHYIYIYIYQSAVVVRGGAARGVTPSYAVYPSNHYLPPPNIIMKLTLIT